MKNLQCSHIHQLTFQIHNCNAEPLGLPTPQPPPCPDRAACIATQRRYTLGFASGPRLPETWRGTKTNRTSSGSRCRRTQSEWRTHTPHTHAKTKKKEKKKRKYHTRNCSPLSVRIMWTRKSSQSQGSTKMEDRGFFCTKDGSCWLWTTPCAELMWAVFPVTMTSIASP